jgi:hypothetical protein
VIAKDGVGVSLSRIAVTGGCCGVKVSAACVLAECSVKGCSEDAFKIERQARVTLHNSCALSCGTGCRVLGDLACHSCDWKGCKQGFVRYLVFVRVFVAFYCVLLRFICIIFPHPHSPVLL